MGVIVEKINISKRELSKLLRENDFIGSGSYGSVFEYGEDEIIKIDHRFLMFFDSKQKTALERFNAGKTGLFCCDIELQQSRLAERRAKITKSTLPRALVYMEGTPIALVMKHHKGYKSLCHLEHSFYEKEIIYDKKVERILELADNAIYHFDGVSPINNLYRDSDGDLQLIDFDGPAMMVCSKNKPSAEKTLLELLCEDYIESNRNFVHELEEYQALTDDLIGSKMDRDRFFELKEKTLGYTKSLGLRSGKHRW